MKKLIIAALFMGLIIFSTAQEIEFIKQDWDLALKKAKEGNKMILVDYFTDWCGWCKHMDKTTFSDSAVVKLVNEKFIALKINAEKDKGIKLAMKYRVFVFPTFAMYDSQGRLVQKVLGFKDAASFIRELEKVTDMAGKGKFFSGISSELEPGFPELYMLAYEGKGKRKFPTEEETKDFLSKQKDLYSEVSFSVLMRFAAGDSLHNFFLENMDKYKELFGEEDVSYKLSSIVDGKYRKCLENNDSIIFTEVLGLVDKYMGANAPYMRFAYTLSFLEKQEKWKEYCAMIKEKVDAGDMKDREINQYCWNIYEKCDDQAVIKTAAGWMDKVIGRSPQYAYIDTYAALLYKSEQFETAEKYALEAIEAGKKENTDVKDTEKLLEKIRSGK